MKIKLALTLLAFMPFCALAQTQINVIKKPNWEISGALDGHSGSKVDLLNSETAMIVEVPKGDFGVVCFDAKLNQKWLTELTGFPMAIGKFKNQIIVVAATDHSYFKSYVNTFKAFVLEERTGKLLSEKIIYDGGKDFTEVPDFFFAEDGSYFKMASRVTKLKRKVHVGIPGLGALTINKVEKDFLATQSYSFIEFNDRLETVQKTEPIMPAGSSWKADFSKDGNFIITAVDAKAGMCNIALYLSNSANPLKTIAVPIDIDKSEEISSIAYASSKTPLINYLAMSYKNVDKNLSILFVKADFKQGTSTISKEVFDKVHLKELAKSFVPVNKKLDDVSFGGTNNLAVRDISEYGNKVLFAISSRSSSYSSATGTITEEGAVLLNIFDQNFKPEFHQIIPREYKSVIGEGSVLAYSLNGNALRVLANHRDGGSVSTIYSELDMTNGKFIKMDFLPKDDIKSGYHASTKSISWLTDSFIIPFADHIRGFSSKVDVQLLQLSYK